MIEIYWVYKGYNGDQFYTKDDDLVKAYATDSRSVRINYFSWLTQLGHGPGYFNNSGVYQIFRKSIFKSETDRDAALFKMSKYISAITIFEDRESYYVNLKAVKGYEKEAKKSRPY